MSIQLRFNNSFREAEMYGIFQWRKNFWKLTYVFIHYCIKLTKKEQISKMIKYISYKITIIRQALHVYS